MDVKTMYFIVGFVMGIVLSAAIPKIPIGLKNLYLEYKKKQENKKNEANSNLPADSKNNVH